MGVVIYPVMFLSVSLCTCRIWLFDVFWYINSRVVYVAHDFIFCELWDNLCAWCYCHFIVFIDIYLTIMISGGMRVQVSLILMCICVCFWVCFRNHNPYLTLNKGGRGVSWSESCIHPWLSLSLCCLLCSGRGWGVGVGVGGGMGLGWWWWWGLGGGVGDYIHTHPYNSSLWAMR